MSAPPSDESERTAVGRLRLVENWPSTNVCLRSKTTEGPESGGPTTDGGV
ncbi:hypothetical protein [Haloprofundus marisrubri]|nr:hypothetical protein [Haloprofundus marisrubri]